MITTVSPHSQLQQSPSVLMVAGVLLVALPWLWPILAGPLSAMLPDLFAWTCGACLLLTVALARRRLRFDVLLASGLTLGGSVNAVIALFQYFDLEDGIGLWIAVAPPTEAFGNLQQRNLLASLLACSLVAVNHLQRNQALGRGVALGLAGLLVTALAATTSRTGFLHLLVLLVCAFVWRIEVRRILVLLVLYVGLSLVLPKLMQAFTGLDSALDLLARMQADYACASRWVIWTNMLELIAARPWVGWGGGELVYTHYMHDYASTRACMKLSHAHNIVLQWAVAWGVPIAVMLCGALIWMVWRLSPWQADTTSERLGWLILVVLGVHSMLEFPLWFGWFQVLGVCALCLVVFSTRPSLPLVLQRGAQVAREMRSAIAGIAVLMMAGLALVSYDYFKVSQLYLPLSLRPEYYRTDTLNRVKDTWLFKDHVLIAQVVSTPVTEQNAPIMLMAAKESLRIAPDSRIIRQLLRAAQLSGRPDLYALHESRYKAAWPDEYRAWTQTSASER